MTLFSRNICQTQPLRDITSYFSPFANQQPGLANGQIAWALLTEDSQLIGSL